MTRSWRIAFGVVGAAVVLFGALVLAGCSGGTSVAPDAGGSPRPGTYPKRGGRVEVVGTLERSDLEGGFWSVVKSTPDTTSGAETIAVIANGDQLEKQLSSLKGAYVRVTGTALNGASIRMAGPEITADTIEELPAP